MAAGILSAVAACTPQPPISVIIAMGAFIGLGTGAVFQNSVLAIREQVSEEQNAVAVGVRNVLRYLGGAIGTAVSGTIMRIILKSRVPEELKEFREHAASAKHLASHSRDQQKLVRAANGVGIMWVFAMSAILLSICAALCFLIRDEPKWQDEEIKLSDSSTPTPSEADASRAMSTTV